MLKPDIEKYLSYVDHLDLSREEKIELINTVWHIMEAFVDHAFGMHPAQQIPGGETRNIVLRRAGLIDLKSQPGNEEQGRQEESEEP
jgi:hypothetical protein